MLWVWFFAALKRLLCSTSRFTHRTHHRFANSLSVHSTSAAPTAAEFHVIGHSPHFTRPTNRGELTLPTLERFVVCPLIVVIGRLTLGQDAINRERLRSFYHWAIFNG